MQRIREDGIRVMQTFLYQTLDERTMCNLKNKTINNKYVSPNIIEEIGEFAGREIIIVFAFFANLIISQSFS